MAARRRRPSGGKGGFEPRARIVARAERVFELSVEGRSQRQIAAELGISQPAVAKILRREEERRLGALPFHRIRLLTRQHARLEHLFTVAADGLERSHSDRRHQQQHQRTLPNGEVHTSVSLSSTSQAGDPRWVREMMRVLGEQRKLFALPGVDWTALGLTFVENNDGTTDVDDHVLTPHEQKVLQRWRSVRRASRTSGGERQSNG